MTTDSESARLLLNQSDDFMFHKVDLTLIYQQLNTSIDGLSTAQVKERRLKYGLNNIPSPINAPAWLCCLLPCILKTKSMQTYNECIPDHAFVKRNRCWVKLDMTSIVPGDIIKIQPGDRVPADVRMIDVKNIEFDTSALNGSKKRLKCDVNNSNSTNTTKSTMYTDASNMALVSYLCTSGEGIAVVAAIGEDTVISKMIRRKEWPLQNEA